MLRAGQHHGRVRAGPITLPLQQVGKGFLQDPALMGDGLGACSRADKLPLSCSAIRAVLVPHCPTSLAAVVIPL